MDKSQLERKSLDNLAFGIYLRTGRRISPSALEAFVEQKFNHNHDPGNGRFTFGSGLGQGVSPATNSARMGVLRKIFGPNSEGRKPATRPNPTSDTASVDHSGLSARFETHSGGDPGMVSTGKGDRGGVSYGSLQLSTRTRTVHEFVASPEAKKWAHEFQGLTPGTPEFSKRRKEVAAKDSARFDAAQRALGNRFHYLHAVRLVANAIGVNIDAASEALKQVTFSTADQHGASGGPHLIVKAIRETDANLRRNDPQYQLALINKIYDLRSVPFILARDRDRRVAQALIKSGNKQRAAFYNRRADVSNSVLVNRFPAERAIATNMFLKI